MLLRLDYSLFLENTAQNINCIPALILQEWFDFERSIHSLASS